MGFRFSASAMVRGPLYNLRKVAEIPITRFKYWEKRVIRRLSARFPSVFGLFCPISDFRAHGCAQAINCRLFMYNLVSAIRVKICAVFLAKPRHRTLV